MHCCIPNFTNLLAGHSENFAMFTKFFFCNHFDSIKNTFTLL